MSDTLNKMEATVQETVAALIARLDKTCRRFGDAMILPEDLKLLREALAARPQDKERDIHDMVSVSRSFLEAIPCPNKCSDGMIINTGPDPQYDSCEFCMYRDIALRASPNPDSLAPSGVERTREEDETGWLIENGKRGGELRYRTMDQGMATWTPDHMQALRFARRVDAEKFAAEDEDAWAIVEHRWTA